MISAETMKWRLQEGRLTEFDLVFWTGKGRVVGAGDDKLSLQVRGKRADYTWQRLVDTRRRLESNQVLTVDEMGGGHDAVGLVSLLAAFADDDIDVVPRDGLLRLRSAVGKPIRPYPGPMLPDSWTPLQRKIDGD